MAVKVTMTDTAYNLLGKRKKEVEFSKLWQQVSETMNIPEAQLTRKKRQFYSELMMDNRFAALKDNKWDLRSRRSYDEMHASDDLEDDEELEEVETSEDDVDTLDLPNESEQY